MCGDYVIPFLNNCDPRLKLWSQPRTARRLVSQKLPRLKCWLYWLANRHNSQSKPSPTARQLFSVQLETVFAQCSRKYWCRLAASLFGVFKVRNHRWTPRDPLRQLIKPLPAKREWGDDSSRARQTRHALDKPSPHSIHMPCIKAQYTFPVPS